MHPIYVGSIMVTRICSSLSMHARHLSWLLLQASGKFGAPVKSSLEGLDLTALADTHRTYATMLCRLLTILRTSLQYVISFVYSWFSNHVRHQRVLCVGTYDTSIAPSEHSVLTLKHTCCTVVHHMYCKVNCRVCTDARHA
eukprot:jgi/Botrbrau1/19548/Bobra.0035s0040.1